MKQRPPQDLPGPPAALFGDAALAFGTDGAAVPTWQGQAACRGCDTDLFFPVGLDGPGRRQADRAKAICRACPVRRQCGDWALRTTQRYGIWGGMDEAELDRAGRQASPSRRCGRAAADHRRPTGTGVESAST